MKTYRTGSITLAALAGLAAGVGAGCQAPPLPTRAAIAAKQPELKELRAGQVYCIRGLIGVFSTGMDRIERQLQALGIRAVTLQHTDGGSVARRIIAEYKQQGSVEPVVLVGHSLGADEVVAVAQLLDKAKVPVALAITVDPVSADPMPPNVVTAVNYYRSGPMDVVPAFRGIPLKQKHLGSGSLTNIDLNTRQDLLEPGTNHFTIDKNGKVEQEIVQRVLAVCPPLPTGGRTPTSRGGEMTGTQARSQADIAQAQER